VALLSGLVGLAAEAVVAGDHDSVTGGLSGQHSHEPSVRGDQAAAGRAAPLVVVL